MTMNMTKPLPTPDFCPSERQRASQKYHKGYPDDMREMICTCELVKTSAATITWAAAADWTKPTMRGCLPSSNLDSARSSRPDLDRR